MPVVSRSLTNELLNHVVDWLIDSCGKEVVPLFAEDPLIISNLPNSQMQILPSCTKEPISDQIFSRLFTNNKGYSLALHPFRLRKLAC